jgi:hypothetical protein
LGSIDKEIIMHKRKDGLTSFLDLWRSCHRPDVLLTLALRLGVDKHLVVRAACASARYGLPFTQDARPLHAIQIAERWAMGDESVTPDHLCELAEECKEAVFVAKSYTASVCASATFFLMALVFAAILGGLPDDEVMEDPSLVECHEARFLWRRKRADIVRLTISEEMIVRSWQEEGTLGSKTQ